MKKFIFVFLSCVLIGCDSQNNEPSNTNSSQSSDRVVKLSANIQVTDFKGSVLNFTQPVERIVALAPHIVENVFTAGAGDKLVGVVTYSDFPEAATKLPIVGGYAKTNLEKILELKPDLVIAWESGNSDASVARIQELGLTVYVDQPDKLKDVAKSIRDIGLLAGTSVVADMAASKYSEKIDNILSMKLGQKPVSTFYQVWNSPIRTINGKHIISNAIALCGGVNIYANESAIAPIINIESILERNPEVILASGMSDSKPEWLEEWKDWPALQAVTLDNLYFVDPDHIQRHTVRILEGIETICAQLQEAREKRG